MADSHRFSVSELPGSLPGHEGEACRAAWVPLIIPDGSAPRPQLSNPSFEKRQGSADQSAGRLSDLFGAPGRFNPAVVLEMVDGCEYWSELDRAWGYADLGKMAVEARHILSRTGFVPGCRHHFVGQHSAGLWFVFPDREGQVSVDKALELEGLGCVSGDPPEYEQLPYELQQASGGPYGQLAWSMMVLKAAEKRGQIESLVRKSLASDSMLVGAIEKGDLQAAARHLSWLLETTAAKAWDHGAYFRAVQIGDLRAEERSRTHRDGALTSARSQAKDARLNALLSFVRELDRASNVRLDNMQVAREAWQAKSAGDPRFSGVHFPDAHQQERPDQLAREIATLRAS